MEFFLNFISFEQISNIWFRFLWKDDEIAKKPFSNLGIDMEYSKNIKKIAKPFFVGIFHNDNIVGVNSFYNSNEEETLIRFRGLWVNELYRGKGLGKKILLFCIEKLSNFYKNPKLIWTLPRKNSFYCYESVGFFKAGFYSNYKMNYGPNCLALKIL